MVIGLLTIAAIPTVTGVAEGVSQQRKVNEEKSEEKRMAKFNLNVYCEESSGKAKYLSGKSVVLRNEKVYIDSPDESARSIPSYTLKAFYIHYPDQERESTLGLVTMVSDAPPMMNWIYVDKNTMELKYGNRTQSIEHHVGPWDWTDDQCGLTLESWEGFSAVEEEDGVWAVYYDRKDNGLKGVVDSSKTVAQISLERSLIEEPEGT